MRLKILTTPPLPDLKAWFSTNSLGPSTKVVDLKKDICSRVQSLKDARICGTDIALVLDDFDLLNESSIDVVRDGDLIYVKLLPARNSTKRKTLHDDSPSRTTQSTHPGRNSFLRDNIVSQQKPQQDSLSENTSGSESSSSDSESSTSSEDSDTDSSTSCSSLPQLQSSKVFRVPVNAIGKPQPTITPLVPPGQGKHTTHSRNLRRRVKKQYDRTADPSRAPMGSSVANTQPLGLKRAEEGAPQTVDSDTLNAVNPETTVMMSSLRNKNKKKGFKNSMANPLPKKIIFNSSGDNRESISSPALPLATTGTTSNAQINVDLSLPRLIPPSEKQQLPPNIFVTVVDVEEDLSSKKKRRQQRETYDSKCWLDYGEAETVGADPTGVDFEYVEQQWDSFPVITELYELKPDTVVGWKGLAINPSTFTPEILLNLAVVCSCNGEEVIVRPLHRPGAAQVSFGDTLGQEEIDTESYGWPDVISSQWRIVDTRTSRHGAGHIIQK